MAVVPKWEAGDRCTYHGLMRGRIGQIITVTANMGGLISCKFPDGRVIGCSPASLRVA